MKSASNALSKQRRRASLLVACLVLIWGCNWPVNKVVLSHISPLWFACLRVAMGSISLFLVQAFRTEGVKLPARADLPVVLSIGLVQVAAVMALVQLGLANVPAGRSAILSYNHARLGGSGGDPDSRRAFAFGQVDRALAGPGGRGRYVQSSGIRLE